MESGWYQMISATGISPGMVAAVAQSMVKVDASDESATSGTLSNSDLARITSEGAAIDWKGQDTTGTWWVASSWTDALGDEYHTLWMRDAAGAWHQTVPVQGGIECSGFGYRVPAEIVNALRSVGVSVFNNN
jgi:hypothetical protein